MDVVVWTYGACLVVSASLMAWVARTLFKNGHVFLVDVLRGDEALADSINRLLVAGFYLINLGYFSLALQVGHELTTAREAFSRTTLSNCAAMSRTGSRYWGCWHRRTWALLT